MPSLQVDAITEDDSLAEREPWFRAVPFNEFVDSTVDDHLFEKRQNPFGAKFVELRCEQEQSMGEGGRHLALLLINEV